MKYDTACIIFTLFYIQRQWIRSKITVTATFISGLDLCIFPCFKYIVYQINSFALIAKCFSSTFIILVLFFVWNHRVSHRVCPPLRTPFAFNQRFQVCYAQKHMREIGHRSFKLGMTWRTKLNAKIYWNFQKLHRHKNCSGVVTRISKIESTIID